MVRSEAMKKIVLCLVIGLTLILFDGCSGHRNNEVESDYVQDANLIETEKSFMDFGQKENWEIAYPYMLMIGKPIKELFDDYPTFKAEDGGYGFVLYELPESEINILFTGNKKLHEYFDGNEFCVGVSGKMRFLFPNAVWPDNVFETEDYLRLHLGLNFFLGKMLIRHQK
jgi:hypothetical protein